MTSRNEEATSATATSSATLPSRHERPAILTLDNEGTFPSSAKGRRTRERLLRAARVVFERDGYLAARVADIAAEAGVAHGTFYTYFRSKTEVFRVLVADVMAMVYDTGNDTRDNRDLTPLQRIERGNRKFVHVYQENGTMLALMESAVSHDDEVRELRLAVRRVSVERIRRSIVRMQDAGIVRTDLDPECSASALVSMVSNFLHFWLTMGEGAYANESVVHTLTQLWASALELRDTDEPRTANEAEGR